MNFKYTAICFLLGLIIITPNYQSILFAADSELNKYNIPISNIPNKNSYQFMRVQLIKHSPTYPEFGFENAFKANPNKSYVAGIAGEKYAYVDLELSNTKPLSLLSIRWENNYNFAKKVRLIELNNYKEKKLYQINIEKGGISHIVLSQPIPVKNLRIEFSEFSGQPRLLLRQIQLYSKNVNEKDILKTSQSNLDEPYLTATDPENPLHIFRLPITQHIKKLSDKLSTGAKNEHEKIINFMHYISQFKVGFASDASPEKTVDEKIGACGTFTNVLVALAAAQKIPSRYVNMMNYPKSEGHTVAEMYFNGKWHLYDSTFSAFYSSKNELSLSFSEIKKRCQEQPDSIYLNARAPRPGLDLYTGCSIFLNASPAGVIGPEHKMIFPLEINYGHQNKIENKDFGTKYQGANFIGAAYINQQQKWHLKNLSIGEKYEFIIQPESIGGELTVSDLNFVANTSLTGGKLIGNSQHNFDFSTSQSSPWIIPFIAQNSEVILNISHPYQGPKFRYVKILYYEIKKIISSEPIISNKTS